MPTIGRYESDNLIENQGTKEAPGREKFERRHPEMKTRGSFTYLSQRAMREESLPPASQKPFPIFKIAITIGAIVGFYMVLPPNMKLLLKSMWEFATGQ